MERGRGGRAPTSMLCVSWVSLPRYIHGSFDVKGSPVNEKENHSKHKDKVQTKVYKNLPELVYLRVVISE